MNPLHKNLRSKYPVSDDSIFRNGATASLTKGVFTKMNTITFSPVNMVVSRLRIPPDKQGLKHYNLVDIEKIVGKYFDMKDTSYLRELKQTDIFMMCSFEDDPLYTLPSLVISLVMIGNSLCEYSRELLRRKMTSKSYMGKIQLGEFSWDTKISYDDIWNTIEMLRDFEKQPDISEFSDIRGMNLEELKFISTLPIFQIESETLDFENFKITHFNKYRNRFRNEKDNDLN